MIDYKKGLKVSSYIVTGSSKDTYPTHIDELGMGGYRTVSSVTDLALIPEARSKVGMLAYVLQTNEIYILTSSGWNKWLSYDNLDLSLEDIKLDIIDLRYGAQHLASNVVNNYLNRSLQKGYIFLGNDFNIAEQRKTIAIDNLPLLGPARFPLPSTSQLSQLGLNIIPGAINALNDFINEHAYLPNPTQPLNITNPSENLNINDIFTLIMGGAWLPETFIGNGSIINPLSRETISSATLAFTKVATARLFKIFENSSFIVSSKATKFTWENSLAELLANTPLLSTIAKLYGYSNTFDFGTNAQALDDIDAGLLKQNKKDGSEKGDGKLVKAIAGTDYVDVQPQLDESFVSLIAPKRADDAEGVDSRKLISRSSIKILQGVGVDENNNPNPDNVRGINSLSAVLLQATNSVTSDKNIIARESVDTTKLNLFDEVSRYQKYVSLKAPATVLENKEWILPQNGVNDQILALKNNKELTFLDPKDVDIANKSATYITRIKDDKLTNSIALKDLVGLLHPNGGLLKIDYTGTPAIAKGGNSVLLGDDYLTPANYVTLDEKIDALAEGLATAVEFQFAADVVFTIAQLLGFASQVASNYRLNELRDQTIILKKAGDNKNTFKTRYNVVFDNNEPGGVNSNWEYGISLLAEDSSLTETFGNNIQPIFFRIGGKSNFITYAQTAKFFAFQVDFINDGTKEKKWQPKTLSLFLGKQDYVNDDRSGYQTTCGSKIDEILEYDVVAKKITLKQNVYFDKNLTVLENIDTKNLAVSNNLTTNNLTATNSTHSYLKVTNNLTLPIYKQAQIPMNQQIGSIFLKIRN